MLKTNPSRVLVIGPDFYNYTTSVANGFNALGIDAMALDYHEHLSISWYSSKRILYSKSKVNQLYSEYARNFNKKVIDIYKSFAPDLVVIIKANIMFAETLEAMKVPKYLWMMDSIARVKETLPLVRFFEKVFLFEKSDLLLKEIASVKSSFLPLACDEKVFFPDKRKEIYSLCFVGELNSNRINLLSKTAKTFPELGSRFYGRYLTNNYGDFFRRAYDYYAKSDWRYFTNTRLAPPQVNKLFNQSSIGINIHHSQSVYGCNQRFFELLGSNTFQLVDNNEYISGHFQGLVETYSNIDELLSKIEFYARNDSERQRLARKGYEEVFRNHTFKHRALTMLEC